VLRLALSLRENGRLLDRSREEALTDTLTGLGNRRALMQALADVLQGSTATWSWFVRAARQAATDDMLAGGAAA